tara:strand:- start:21 stop:758 length:738 start_codon:yes stop_codon:yes gene_type:complete
MLRKRVVTFLTFYNGILFRTKQFKPDYRYTANFVDAWSIDEIVIVDVTKNRKTKKKFLELISRFSKECFVPLTAGGGIQKLEHASELMRVGADKIILNTGAIKNPLIISDLTKSYGSQCVIGCIEFKKINNNYSVCYDSGKLTSKVNPLEWAKKLEQLGIGELLLISIDKDGSLSGYDLDFLEMIREKIKVPILIGGGAGSWNHFEEGLKSGADAVCTSNIYHFTEKSISSAKLFLKKKNLLVRS